MSGLELLQPAKEAADEETARSGAGYGRYLLGKGGGALFSLAMVVIVGFFAFRILPGDPVAALQRMGHFTPQQMATLRHQYGLDRPLMVQFWVYLEQLAHGDLGESFTFNRSVASLIGAYIGPTLLLMSVSAALSIVIGIWFGQRSAWRRDGWFDRASTGVALVLWSVPTFWLGMLLLLLFAGVLHLLPTSGMVTPGTSYTGFAWLADVGRHLILPTLTLVAVTYAQYSLIMRASLLEEMSSAYLVTARAKGLTDDQVRLRHAIPNALLPTVTIIFLQIAGLIAGAVTVETVFSWPGLGYLTFQALQGPDLPLLQGTFVVFSSLVILMNLVADLVYRTIDPRVRDA